MNRRPNGQDDNLSWILKYTNEFEQEHIESQHMHILKQEQFGQLKQSDEILSAQLFTFWNGNLENSKFILMPNLLIKVTQQNGMLMPPQQQFNLGSGAFYLSLSECTITQKMIAHKSQQAFGMMLSNSIGTTYLFFSNFVTFRTWYKQMKQFCKLTGFLEKYKLGEKILPGFYTCTKKKKKTQYTCQIYKTDDFEQCKELEDAVYNEIQILRSIRHQSLLELKRVYENSKYLFIVYEYYKGETLFNLLNSNLQLHEVQIASIIYQILSVVKFLNQHQFYHGSINPQNILINTQHQMLQITLINLSFKEYKVNDKLDWILNRAVESFLAPEIFEGIAPNIATDIYALGCVLYFMTYYDPKKYELTNEEKDFYTVMDSFEILTNRIDESEQKLKVGFQQNQSKSNVSSSQLDLLRKMLEQDSSKLTIKDATKHHWFVNVKSKIKSLKVERKRKKPLPSLRTIIELREMSEMDVRMTIIQQQQSGLNAINHMNSKLQSTPSNTKRTLVYTQQPSKLSQYAGKNEFDDDYEIPDEDLSLEVPVINYKREPKRKPSNIRLL
ncbi:unnamed protein product [Paramecium octaurelia]|uniref:Protein kinase domain-containing protein n=1 Tax=Paramecium octaurelia TaxID=43137 RepID=A0A8S1YHT8_PAROT|nr:unnamed protein product [Paramecium octaurelia]